MVRLSQLQLASFNHYGYLPLVLICQMGPSGWGWAMGLGRCFGKSPVLYCDALWCSVVGYSTSHIDPLHDVSYVASNTYASASWLPCSSAHHILSMTDTQMNGCGRGRGC